MLNTDIFKKKRLLYMINSKNNFFNKFIKKNKIMFK